MNRSPLLPAAVLWLAATGCVAGNKLNRWQPPGGPVESVEVERVPVTGAHIDVVASGVTVEGELLAIDANHFWILSDGEGHPWTYVHRAAVSSVHIRLYDTYPGVNAAISVGGLVSTLTNGYYLAATAPLWIIAGSVSVVSAAMARHYGVDPWEYDLLGQFARFPEGIPPTRGQCPEHPAPVPVRVPTAP